MVGEETWNSRDNHVLVTMIDGKVLDWYPTDGSWSLWKYDPNIHTNCLPGNPVGHGQWGRIRGDLVLITMGDGKVLDWHPIDGHWRLWNYDPSRRDCLPGEPVQEGRWQSITDGHRLVTMHDGKVLDYVPADGSWRLWNYDPNRKDCLPGDPVRSGRWRSIGEDHVLVTMGDGKVLDYVPGDGSWKLWDYDPNDPAGCLPGEPAGEPVGQGQWGWMDRRHVLVTMGDRRVLAWIPENGLWKLWDYDPY
jgi:hypothetical protein